MAGERSTLVTVDIGNTRTKVGLFAEPLAAGLPHPERTLALDAGWADSALSDWLAAPADQFDWRIASVNRVGTARLQEWFAKQMATPMQVLKAKNVPMSIEVTEPDKVGMDRLANALGADRLRTSGQRAIAVDLGSAITVDLVSVAGAYLGGAIMPGIAMSARALHEFTDLLPLEPMFELSEPPAVLGKTTSTCLRSGLYWGAIGAVQELVRRMSGSEPTQLFVTGGAGPAAAQLLRDNQDAPASLVPHLTLAGIALMDDRVA